MYLTGGQAKLDKNKNNKIDAQDFAILRKEKAKGRGKGLQDEKMKPGKVKPVKAVLGLAAMGVLGAKFLKDRKKKLLKFQVWVVQESCQEKLYLIFIRKNYQAKWLEGLLVLWVLK